MGNGRMMIGNVEVFAECEPVEVAPEQGWAVFAPGPVMVAKLVGPREEVAALVRGFRMRAIPGEVIRELSPKAPIEHGYAVRIGDIDGPLCICGVWGCGNVGNEAKAD
jgi:hypothetical protein